MENLEKQKMSEKTKMEVLNALYEIIWDTNRLIGKLADCDREDFDLDQFKHDLNATCKFLHNDTYKLEHIDL